MLNLTCFVSVISGCLGFFCPCCLYGRNMERLGEGSCCACCFLFALTMPLYLCFIPGTITRGRLRAKYGTDGSCCVDCLTWFFCAPCALCQEAREIKARGTVCALICRKTEVCGAESHRVELRIDGIEHDASCIELRERLTRQRKTDEEHQDTEH